MTAYPSHQENEVNICDLMIQKHNSVNVLKKIRGKKREKGSIRTSYKNYAEQSCEQNSLNWKTLALHF